MAIKIAALSGSLRKGSYTTKLLKAFKNAAPEGVEIDILSIDDLPLINQDMEESLPAPVQKLHKEISQADAVLLATPEYNRSYSPVIKNAIDWGSRPEGNNVWDKKPAAIIGCSPYNLGAFGAVHHLRQVMVYVNTYIMQQPEFYLSNVAGLMDEQGNITDEKTLEKMRDFFEKYVAWIRNF